MLITVEQRPVRISDAYRVVFEVKDSEGEVGGLRAVSTGGSVGRSNPVTGNFPGFPLKYHPGCKQNTNL